MSNKNKSIQNLCKNIIIFAILCCSSILNAQTISLEDYPKSVKKLIKKGDKILTAHSPHHREYYIAFDLYAQAYSKAPSSIAVQYRYAICNLKLKDNTHFIESLDILNNIVKNYPEISTDIWYHLGIAYREKWLLDSKRNLYSVQKNALDSAIIYFKKQITTNANAVYSQKAQRAIEECEYALASLKIFNNNFIQPFDKLNSEYDDFNPQYRIEDSVWIFSTLRPKNASIKYGLGSSYGYSVSDSTITSINNFEVALITSIHPNGDGFLTCFDGNIYEYNKNIKGRTRIEKPINVINSKQFNEINATYADDGNTIYFSTNCPDGYYSNNDKSTNNNNYNIYKITRTLTKGKKENKPMKEHWSSPEKLSSNINTPYDESMFVQCKDSNNVPIYYLISNGHQSFGGLDVFLVKTDNESYSEPINMNYPINTPGQEGAFAINPTNAELLLSSDRLTSIGGLDIYKVVAGTSIENLPLINYNFELFDNNDETIIAQDKKEHLYLSNAPTETIDTNGARGGTVAMIKVVDEDGNAIKASNINADIYPIGQEYSADNKISSISGATNEFGELLLVLPELSHICLTNSKQGFTNFNDTLSALEGYHEIYKTIVIKKDNLEEKEKVKENKDTLENIQIKDIYFDYDKFTLRDASLVELNKILQIVKKHSNTTIEIMGHTDSNGTDEYNQTLSLNRAKVVFNWFIKHGINKSRMSYQGYSFHKPVSTNDTDEGRQLNRRTEIKIKK